MPKHEVSDTGTFHYLVSTWVIRDIRSLYSVLVVRLSRSSCLHLCIPGWCPRGMGLGDAPIGDAAGDYLTGIPALGEVPSHVRLLVYLLRGRLSFLRRRRPDQCPPQPTIPLLCNGLAGRKSFIHPPPKKKKKNIRDD